MNKSYIAILNHETVLPNVKICARPISSTIHSNQSRQRRGTTESTYLANPLSSNMTRRAFLTTTGAVSVGLVAGCIDRLGRTEYEECSQTIILMKNLPDEANEEVTTALQDGSYETDDGLYLTDIMDPDSSYLQADSDDSSGRIYYQPVIESRNGLTGLTVEEVIPTRRGSIELENKSGTDVSVSVHIVFEPHSETIDDEVLIDEDFEIAAGDEATLVSGDVRYGSYTAEIDFHSEKEVAEESWWVNIVNRPPDLILTDEMDVWAEQAVIDGWRYCEWDSSGDLKH